MSHRYGRSSLWTTMCWDSVFLVANDLPHTPHSNGFNPENKQHTVDEFINLFNEALNTFYLRLDGVRIYKQMKEVRKEKLYLTMHSTHFIYGYMASDIWLRTILIVRKETRCRHIGYSLRLTARIAHTMAFVTPVVEHWLE